MLIELTGVLEDGGSRSVSVPTNPRKTLSVPKGASLTVRLRVVRTNGQAVTGGTARLSVSAKAGETPTFYKEVTLADPVDITIAPADTKNLNPGLFAYDVWHTDGSSNRNAVVPTSPFHLEPTTTPVP